MTTKLHLIIMWVTIGNDAYYVVPTIHSYIN